MTNEPSKTDENRRNLTRRQQRALACLLDSRSLAEAARRAKCSESTLRLYLRNETFKAEYQRQLDALLDDATGRIKKGIGPALDSLRDIAEDPRQPPAPRVAAARGLIEAGLKVIRELEDRQTLESLERQLREIREDRR